jgi:hypothetical protein
MSDGAYHAKLSPSGAHRWMACPGSVVLEAAYPDSASVYADEGTAAHTLAAWCLTDRVPAEEYIGEVIRVGERSFAVDKTMAGYVADYVKLVRELQGDGTLLVERQVPIGHLTSEDGATGTADAVIIKASQRNLTVVDLKYGMGVQVDAVANPQLQMYGLGAYEAYSLLADFDTVSLYIHMPRLNHVSEYHLSVDELLEFGRKVREAATAVEEACILTTVNASDAELNDAGHFNPGEKQCRFCRAKATCPALLAEVTEITSGSVATADDFAQFAPVEPVTIAETGDNYLSMAMDKVGLVEDWCKAVRAEVERRLTTGLKVPGYKLVEGKQGNRQWIDPDKAEAAMKALKLKADEIYDKKLISPTTADKLLKNDPKKWAKLAELITRSSGKPSVAHATDKRPELVVHTATADEFAALANTE